MGRLSLAAVMMCLAAGCNVTAQGVIVDGMTGTPIAGTAEDTPPGKEMRIFFRAIKKGEDGKVEENLEAGGLCLVKEAIVAADGTYTVADLCSSATEYSIDLSDKNLFLADTNGVPMGYEGSAPLELKVWRAPKGTGVFKLKGSQLSRVGSATDLRADFVFKSEEKVISPKEIKSVPLIVAGEYLLLSGLASKYEVLPLVNSGKRRLGKAASSNKEWIDQAPWAYAGVNFVSDTEIERKTTTVDEAKVVTKTKDAQTARYMGGDSVAPGRYVIVKDGGKRGWIVDFGEKGTNPGQ